MKLNQMKNLGVAAVAVALAMSAGLLSTPARSAGEDDMAALYKTKCVICHGAKAEKKFDATKSDDDDIQIVLKGKKMEKPPNMPAFEEKGITADQAKALVDYMKALKQ